MTTEIIIQYAAEGFHYWPGASGRREYLGQRHRHLFRIRVGMPVDHDDREVELHDFLDFCKALWPGPELGSWSCEMLAREMGKEIERRYGRLCWVEVYEDGEVGARVTREADD